MAKPDEVRYGVWLLWVGIGLGTWFASLGYHYLFSQTVMLFFIGLWSIQNIQAKLVVRGILFTACEAFFKDFDVEGSMRVPDEGPVILACAPHANQFVDPLVVLKAISSRQDIGFLAAAKTMRKKYIGAIAKTTQAIPVERPQDLATTGAGTVEVAAGSCVVSGHGTRFSTALKVGDLLYINSGEEKGCTARIKAIDSDTQLTLKRPLKWPVTGTNTGVLLDRLDASSYKIHPLLDQSAVFEAVFDRLNEGHCVGIFPEGGSHDRTQLLPIKQGVSVMALGAMAKYPHMMSKLKIIPVGINYFNGHRFRSRVFVEIGEPILPDPMLVEKYRKGGQEQKNAQIQLLEQVASGLAGVTIDAGSFDELQFLRAVRRLYKPTSIKASPAERMALMMAFSQAYKRDKEDERVKILYAEVLEYRIKLKRMQISDHQVSRSHPRDTLVSTATAVFTLVKSVVYLVACCCVFLPGLVVIWPWRFLTRYISKKKAAEALKGSSVKIAGRDVVATWKLMTSICMLPIQHVLYTLILYYLGGESYGVGYFFFAPFIAILTVLATERGWELFHTIQPLWLALISPETSSDLIDRRSKLKKSVRDLVSEMHWDTNLLKSDTLGRKAVRRLSRFDSDDMLGTGRNFDDVLCQTGFVPSDDEE